MAICQWTSLRAEMDKMSWPFLGGSEISISIARITKPLQLATVQCRSRNGLGQARPPKMTVLDCLAANPTSGYDNYCTHSVSLKWDGNLPVSADAGPALDDTVALDTGEHGFRSENRSMTQIRPNHGPG